MKKLYELLEKAIDILMGSFLALMGLFILGNVLLRYFFNYSLTWAEELSRFLFVWITFLGAIGALKNNKHLGFTSLIKKMSLPFKKFFFALSNLIVMYILYLVFVGSIEMTKLGFMQEAPSTGLPMAYMWIVGIIMSFMMFVIIVRNLYKAMFVAGAINGLIDLSESEDELDLEKIHGGEKKI
jgi:TRAP-type C4-dicarboxylate transport system permease small subunit